MTTRYLKLYWRLLLLLSLSFALNSCQSEDAPLCGEPNGKPIHLAASTYWPEIKSVINSVDDLAGNGFVVWADWAKDPADNSLFGGDYSGGVNNKVFGPNGTKVYHGGTSSAGTTIWTYSPTRYWYRGTYNFAALLPASAFNSTYATTADDATGKMISAVQDASGTSLTLTFNPTFNLAEAQTDLMYAFTSVDNKAEDKNDVALNFYHAFSQLSIRIASDEESKTFSVNKIEIYGIHKSLASPLMISNSDNTGQIRGKLADMASAESPFATFNRPDDSVEWDIKGEGAILIDKLIVFPESWSSSSSNGLTIKVHYDGNKEIVAKVAAADWQPNKKYTYTLNASSIKIGEPEVTPWADGESFESEIK